MSNQTLAGWGTSLEWFANGGAKASDFSLSLVDNGAETYFDAYRCNACRQCLLLATPNVGNGAHTMKVRVRVDEFCV